MPLAPTLGEMGVDILETELICNLKNLGDHVKWPQNKRPEGPPKGGSLWCDYHQGYGHHTEDCIVLKIEVHALLRKGFLK